VAQKFVLTAQLKLAAPTNVATVVRAINAGLRGVSVNVHINTSGVNSQLSKINQQLNHTSKAAHTAKNEMEKFGEQAALAIRRYGAFTLATTAFIKLTNSISAGIDDAIKFDREMVRIAQVTGSSVAGVKDLGDEVTRLSKEFGVSSSKMLEASVTLAQAGLSAKNVKVALEALAKTGVSATFGDIKDTTEAAIAIMQQFGKEAKDLEGIMSSINAVSAKFAVESEDIAVAVRRTGGAFAAAGGSLEEFQALFTSVRQTTRESAETISTGFRTIFTRLQRTRTQNFLQSMGIDLKGAAGELDAFGKNIEGQFVGPYEAIRRLSVALKDLKGTDPRFAQIVEELGGFRQISKVIPLITKFDVAQQALNVSMRGGNSLTKDAELAQQALSVQIAKVREEFLSLLRNVANNSAFRGMLDLTLKLSSSLVKLADSLQPIIPLLAAVGAAKLSSSFGSFAKGFSAKFMHADGGAIKKFASGGLVPGHGDGDTVPAQLTPGEYVIRKNAVKAIGVNNLHKMNGYANGGFIRHYSGGAQGTLRWDAKANTYAYGDTLLRGPDFLGGKTAKEWAGNGPSLKSLIESGSVPPHIVEAARVAALGQKAPPTAKPPVKSVYGARKNLSLDYINVGDVVDVVTPDEKLIGQAAKTKIRASLGTISKATSSSDKSSKLLIQKFAAANGIDEKSAAKTIIGASTKVYGLNDKIGTSFNENAFKGVSQAIHNVIENSKVWQSVGATPPKGVPNIDDIISNSAKQSVKGILFEGVVRHALGQKIPAGKDKLIDFSAADTEFFGNIFHQGNELVGKPAEAKANIHGDALYSAVLKTLKTKYLENDSSESFEKVEGTAPKPRRRHASGGFAGSGTDTVPALLTPGEFVINKKAAQRIGGPTLNKLNKADKYATGGFVRGYSNGGTVGSTLGNPLVLGILLSSMEGFAKQLSGGNKDFEKLSGAITSVIFQFSVLKTVVDGVKSTMPQLHGIKNNDTRSQEAITESISAGRQHLLTRANKKIMKSRTDWHSISALLPAGTDIDMLQAQEDERIQKRLDATKARFDKSNATRGAAKYGSFGNKFARFAQPAAAFAGAAAIGYGNHLSEIGNEQINKGNADGVSNAAWGGALSGAGTGASVGAAFGPIGIASGAVSGAIIGYADSIEKANKDLQAVKIGKSLTEFSDMLDKISSGKLSARTARGDIISQVNHISDSLIGQSADGVKDIKSKFTNNSGQIEAFITEISKDYATFEELEKATGHLISQFSVLTNLPYAKLKTQLQAQITANQKVAAFSKLNKALLAEETRQIQLLHAMSAAINTVTDSFGKFDSRMTNLASFAGGGGAHLHSADASSILERASKGRAVDIGQLGKIGDAFTGQFGKGGQDQSEKLLQSTQALAMLPSILTEAKNNTGIEDDGEEFMKSFEKAIKAKMPGASEAIVKSLMDGAKHVMGAEAKDGKITTDITTNVEQVAGEVGKGLHSTIELFKEFAPAFKTQGDRINAAWEAYATAQIHMADIEQQIAHKGEGFLNFIAEATDVHRSAGSVRAGELNRIGKLTGGVTDPAALGRTLESLQAKADKLSQEANAEHDVDKKNGLASEAAKTNVQIAKTRKALDELANSTEGLSAIQKELALEEEKRQFKGNILKTAIFGSQEAKMEQAKNLGMTGVAMAHGIDAVPEQERESVLKFLESAGKQKINGVEADEIVRRLAERSMAGRMVDSNGNAGLTRGILTKGADANSQALMKQADEINQTQVKALEAVSTNIGTQADKISIAIADQNKQFLSDLRAIYKEQMSQQKQTEIDAAVGDRSVVADKIKAKRKIAGMVGGTYDDENRGTVDGALSNLKAYREALKKKAEASEVSDFKSDAGSSKSFRNDAIRHMQKMGIDNPEEELQKITRNMGMSTLFTPDGGLNTAWSGRADAQKSINEHIDSIKKKRLDSVNAEVNDSRSKLNSTAEGRALGAGLDPNNLHTFDTIIKSMETELKNLGSGPIDKLSEELNALNINIAALRAEKAKAGMSKGGPVGFANGGPADPRDKIPALLRRGEFVLTPEAVNRIGLSNVQAMNDGTIKRFGSGGLSDEELRNMGRRSGWIDRTQYNHKPQYSSNNKTIKYFEDENVQNRLFGYARAAEFRKETRALDRTSNKEEADRLRAKRMQQFAYNQTVKGFNPNEKMAGSNKTFAEQNKSDLMRQAMEDRLKAPRKKTVLSSNPKPKGSAWYYGKRAEGSLVGSISRDYKVAQAKLAKSSKGKNKAPGQAVQNSNFTNENQVKYNQQQNNGGMPNDFGSTVEKFSTVVTKLEQTLGQFKDMKITLTGKHDVNVTIIGAEALKTLEPTIKGWITQQVIAGVNHSMNENTGGSAKPLTAEALGQSQTKPSGPKFKD